MTTKSKHVGMFLLVGTILAVAAVYVFPMQAAMACGGGCGGGGKKGGGSGGSLVNVEDNNIGNVKDNDIKFLNHDKILSNNKIKDVNVLSKNGEANVLSKNYNNILSENGNNNNVEVTDVANDLHNNIVKHNNVGTSVLSDYFKQICGC
jgi:hypothetical protein